MIEFYPQIKAVHVASVLLSVTLFSLRGMLVLVGRDRLAHHWLPRWLSWGIDTVLLSAALMLVSILPGAVFGNHWLSVKLVLLLVYIGLGSLALRRARTGATRMGFLVAAWITFVLMFGIARMHEPLGWFAVLWR